MGRRSSIEPTSLVLPRGSCTASAPSAPERSRDFVHSQTELVILVTPYMAYSGTDDSKPTDNMEVAGDAESIFLGHMEKIYGVGSDGMRGSYTGSVGFVLD
jgi:pilus assembly protein CpaC